MGKKKRRRGSPRQHRTNSDVSITSTTSEASDASSSSVMTMLYPSLFRAVTLAGCVVLPPRLSHALLPLAMLRPLHSARPRRAVASVCSLARRRLFSGICGACKTHGVWHDTRGKTFLLDFALSVCSHAALMVVLGFWTCICACAA